MRTGTKNKNSKSAIKTEIQECFKCESCEDLFLSRRLLEEHVNEEHEGLVKYGCNACQFKALKYAALKKHAKREHNGTKDLIINFGREIRKTKELSCRVCCQIIKEGLKEN